MKAAKEQREKADSRRGWGARKKAQGEKKKKLCELIKKAKRCVWWVIIRKTVREEASLF